MDTKKLRYKVLFLASWYPNRVNPLLGVFVHRKARAVHQLCDVAVVAVAEDPSLSSSYEVVHTVEYGIPTTVVYFRPSRNPLLKGVLYNVRYCTAFFLGWSRTKATWGLPDFLHVHVVDRAGYFALLLKWLRKFEFVVTEHSTPDIDYLKGVSPRTRIPLRFLKSLVIRNAGALNVDSQPSLQYLVKAGFRGNFFVIPNVVEINEAVLSRPKPVRQRKTALHISNLITRKNVEGILEVCADVYSSGRRDFEFHIIGEGANRKNLELFAEKLGVLNTCVFFRGAVTEEEKQIALCTADFHVLNSDEEGFSVVTAEAICYGTPVIATACGGPEDFVDTTNGLLVERRNGRALRDAFLHMLDYSDSYDKQAMRESGKTRFSPDVIAQATHEMYSNSMTRWHAGNTEFPVIIPRHWRVLDVGSGHQPNHRANFLLERYLEPTIHRTIQNVPVPSDKSMIVGDALSMPLRDKSFDFVVASHIAEHVDDPVKFCAELQRVASSGYFETPGPLTEWLMPTASHKWIVYKKGATLIFKGNPYRSSAFPFFFRFFYLNRDGYVPNTWKTSSPLLLALNFLLLKLWSSMPYAYTKIKWETSIAERIVRQ